MAVSGRPVAVPAPSVGSISSSRCPRNAGTFSVHTTVPTTRAKCIVLEEPRLHLGVEARDHDRATEELLAARDGAARVHRRLRVADVAGQEHDALAAETVRETDVAQRD